MYARKRKELFFVQEVGDRIQC